MDEEGHGHGLFTDNPRFRAERSILTSPSYVPTQLVRNLTGAYIQEIRDNEPTQLLESDDFYENETEDMFHHHGEDCFGDYAEDFLETQLLDDYDDTGGCGTPSAQKCLGVHKLKVVDADAETEDDEDELYDDAKQEAEAKQLSPTHRPLTQTSGRIAEDVGVDDNSYKKPPSLTFEKPSSPTFKSIGSFRAESMRETAVQPLTWKLSIFVDVATSRDRVTSMNVGSGPSIPEKDVTNALSIAGQIRGSLLQESQGGDKEEERPQESLGSEDANLEASVPSVLSEPAHDTPSDQTTCMPPAAYIPKVDGLTTAQFDVVHPPVQNTPEPEWIVRKTALDAVPALRVFGRRHSTTAVPLQQKIAQHLDRSVKGDVQKDKDAKGEVSELVVGPRPRELFPESEASKDETKPLNFLRSGATYKPNSDVVLQSKEDVVPLESMASLDWRMEPRSNLLSRTESMSYLYSEEPGEERQAQALNIVDKLVWLNNADGLEGPVLPGLRRVNSLNRPSITPALEGLAQVAEAHKPRNSLGVYEWVDSQHDGAGPAFGIGEKDETSTVPVVKACYSRFRSGTVTGKGKKEDRTGRDQAQQQHVRFEDRLENTKSFLEKNQLDQRTKSLCEQNSAVKATGEKDLPRSAQIVTRGRRRSAAVLSVDSDHLISKLKRPASGTRVIPGNDIVKIKPVLVQKELKRGREKGEEVDDETLLSMFKVIKRRNSKVEDGNKTERKRKASTVRKEDEVLKAAVVERVQKRTKIAKDGQPAAKQLRGEAGGPVRTRSANERQKTEKGHEYDISMQRAGNGEMLLRSRKKAKGTPLLGPAAEAGKHVDAVKSDRSCPPRSKSPRSKKTQSPAIRRSTSDKATRNAKEVQHAEEQDEGILLANKVVEVEGSNENTKKGTRPSMSRPVAATCNQEKVKTPTPAIITRTMVRQMQRMNDAVTAPSTPPASTPLPLGKLSPSTGELRAPLDSERIKKPSLVVGTRRMQRQSHSTTDSSMILSCSAPATPSSMPQVEGRTSARRGRNAGKPSSAKPPKRKQGIDVEPNVLSAATSDTPKPIPSEGPLSTSTEKRRKREASTVRVLFSHGLDKFAVKHQCQILGKLGGKSVKTSAECTHFVTDKFQRTGNMLEAMAGGKPVVTPTWLESCGQAHCFLEGREFLLEDEEKEQELGFSMYKTISAAQQKRILQGVKVYITPNTSPPPQALGVLVTAAGGEVVESYTGSSPKDQTENPFVVISNEKDYDVCVPFLEQGTQVCSPELIFDGIITHHLDFTKHQLFESHRSGRRQSRH